MSAKLNAALPKGANDGLSAISEQLVDQPHRVRVVLALVDCKSITTDADTGDVIPTARIRRIEAITDPADGARLVRLLKRSYERRTGQTVLPLDLEDDLASAFDTLDVDPRTGEIRGNNDDGGQP
jgi:hypothetical protein